MSLCEGWKYVENIKVGRKKYLDLLIIKQIYVIVNNRAVDIHKIKWITFPYCYDLSSKEKYNKWIYAFTAFISSINPEFIHSITCASKHSIEQKEKDCDVSISYFDTYDLISLQENENHGQFL